MAEEAARSKTLCKRCMDWNVSKINPARDGGIALACENRHDIEIY